MRTLRDLLACPVCRGHLRDSQAALFCDGCNARYPVIGGVPVLLPEVTDEAMVPRFEADLPPRPGYSKWKERLLIRSAPACAAILDVGCGYQELDDPNIVRMDACLHPYADVVGDVHRLPFKDQTFQLAFGGAVFEHLHDPWAAARELARVLGPGGYLYADWNFVFAYHGYPSHFFNASISGVQRVFESCFDVIETGVAPFQGPGAALRQVVGTYLQHFEATDDDSRTFRHELEMLLLRPLERLDRHIPPDDRHRIAAGIYVVATRPGHDACSLIDGELWQRWHDDPALRGALPDPRRLAEPQNLVRRVHGADVPMRDAPVFSKDGSGRPRHPAIAAWPDDLLDAPEIPADQQLREDLRATMLARRRPLTQKIRDAVRSPSDVLRLPARVTRWLWWRVQYARGRTP